MFGRVVIWWVNGRVRWCWEGHKLGRHNNMLGLQLVLCFGRESRVSAGRISPGI